jgi:hypothetical protein
MGVVVGRVKSDHSTGLSVYRSIGLTSLFRSTATRAHWQRVADTESASAAAREGPAGSGLAQRMDLWILQPSGLCATLAHLALRQAQ